MAQTLCLGVTQGSRADYLFPLCKSTVPSKCPQTTARGAALRSHGSSRIARIAVMFLTFMTRLLPSPSAFS